MRTFLAKNNQLKSNNKLIAIYIEVSFTSDEQQNKFVLRDQTLGQKFI